eukprot:TRINITY_DN4017_c0_g1_i5.p1 TRINITY_DN4017_c0_g1~~TRINITY_DN4017_c0_g1_i5.p1  ORF type:complete len:3294 (-),score=474.19 TRINITY_DN4017_c0_g1_i5:153-10034(-)
MFEKLVSTALTRVLSNYVHIDGQQLSVSLWQGNVVLKNLKFKKYCLDKFFPAVVVKYGEIGQLTLQVPWHKLRNEPVVAIAEDVYICIVSKTEEAFNPEEEETQRKERESYRLQMAESAFLSSAQTMLLGQEVSNEDNIISRIVDTIVNNVQVQINRIHFRYEDNISNAKSMISLGVYLENLKFETTDSEGKPSFFVGSLDSILQKVFSLRNFSVYYETCSKLAYEHADWKNRFSKPPIVSQNSETSLHYVIHPVSLNVKVKKLGSIISSAVAQLARIHPETPFLDIFIELTELHLSLHRDLYRWVFSIFDLNSMFERSMQFRHLRPKGFGRNAKPKEKWNYSIKCILHAITERRKSWRWETMRQYGQTRRMYTELYKRKARLHWMSPLSDGEIQFLGDLEEIHSFEQIMNLRMIAEMQLRKEIALYKQDEKRSPHTPQKQGWGAWAASYVWKAPPSPSQAPKEDYSNMSETERNELYKLLQYDPNVTSFATELPEDYAKIVVNAKLDKLTLSLKAGEHNSLLASSTLKSFGASILVFPKSYSISCSLSSIELVDGIQDVVVISTISQSPGSDSSADMNMERQLKGIKNRLPFDGSSRAPTVWWNDHIAQFCDPKNQLRATWISKPKNVEADYSLTMNFRPIKVMVTPTLVRHVIDFFSPPEDIDVRALLHAASTAAANVVENTKKSFATLLNEHRLVDLDLHVFGPTIILPCDDVARNAESFIFNMGCLTVQSGLTKDLEGSMEKLKEKLEIQTPYFDIFSFHLEGVSLHYSMNQEGEMLLNPVNVNTLALVRHIADRQYPKVSVSFQIPQLSFNISPRRLILLNNLIKAITFMETLTPSDLRLKPARTVDVYSHMRQSWIKHKATVIRGTLYMYEEREDILETAMELKLSDYLYASKPKDLKDGRYRFFDLRPCNQKLSPGSIQFRVTNEDDLKFWNHMVSAHTSKLARTEDNRPMGQDGYVMLFGVENLSVYLRDTDGGLSTSESDIAILHGHSVVFDFRVMPDEQKGSVFVHSLKLIDPKTGEFLLSSYLGKEPHFEGTDLIRLDMKMIPRTSSKYEKIDFKASLEFNTVHLRLFDEPITQLMQMFKKIAEGVQTPTRSTSFHGKIPTSILSDINQTSGQSSTSPRTSFSLSTPTIQAHITISLKKMTLVAYNQACEPVGRLLMMTSSSVTFKMAPALMVITGELGSVLVQKLYSTTPGTSQQGDNCIRMLEILGIKKSQASFLTIEFIKILEEESLLLQPPLYQTDILKEAKNLNNLEWVADGYDSAFYCSVSPVNITYLQSFVSDTIRFINTNKMFNGPKEASSNSSASSTTSNLNPGKPSRCKVSVLMDYPTVILPQHHFSENRISAEVDKVIFELGYSDQETFSWMILHFDFCQLNMYTVGPLSASHQGLFQKKMMSRTKMELTIQIAVDAKEIGQAPLQIYLKIDDAVLSLLEAQYIQTVATIFNNILFSDNSVEEAPAEPLQVEATRQTVKFQLLISKIQADIIVDPKLKPILEGYSLYYNDLIVEDTQPSNTFTLIASDLAYIFSGYSNSSSTSDIYVPSIILNDDQLGDDMPLLESRSINHDSSQLKPGLHIVMNKNSEGNSTMEITLGHPKAIVLPSSWSSLYDFFLSDLVGSCMINKPADPGPPKTDSSIILSCPTVSLIALEDIQLRAGRRFVLDCSLLFKSLTTPRHKGTNLIIQNAKIMLVNSTSKDSTGTTILNPTTISVDVKERESREIVIQSDTLDVSLSVTIVRSALKAFESLSQSGSQPSRSQTTVDDQVPSQLPKFKQTEFRLAGIVLRASFLDSSDAPSPILMTTLFLKSATVLNDQQRTKSEFDMHLELQSFNGDYGKWEPLIEPCEFHIKSSYGFQALQPQFYASTSTSSSGNPEEGFRKQSEWEIHAASPIYINAFEKGLKAINGLLNVWALDENEQSVLLRNNAYMTPYLFRNLSNYDIQIQDQTSRTQTISLPSGQEVACIGRENTALGFIYEKKTAPFVNSTLLVPGYSPVTGISFEKPGKYIIQLESSLVHESSHIVAETRVDEGRRIITFMPRTVIRNYTCFPLEIRLSMRGSTSKALGLLEPSAELSVPPEYLQSSFISIRPMVQMHASPGSSNTLETIYGWSSIRTSFDLARIVDGEKYSCDIHCPVLVGASSSSKDIWIKGCMVDMIQDVIILRPVISIRNAFPAGIRLSLYQEGSLHSMSRIDPGDMLDLYHINPERNCQAVVGFLGNYTSSFHPSRPTLIHTNPKDNSDIPSVLEFVDILSQRVLQCSIMNHVDQSKCRLITLFTSHSLVNHTGFNLMFMEGYEQYYMIPGTRDNGITWLPYMFNVVDDVEPRISVAINTMRWCKPFAIDKDFEISLQIEDKLQKSRSTTNLFEFGVKSTGRFIQPPISVSCNELVENLPKVFIRDVTFFNRFLIINRASNLVYLRQFNEQETHYVTPKGRANFHWTNNESEQAIQIAMLDETKTDPVWSAPIYPNELGDHYIKIRSTQRRHISFIYVNIRCVGAILVITVWHEKQVSPPYRIENQLGVPISFCQKAYEQDMELWNILGPGQSCSYAWEDEKKKHKLAVMIGGVRQTIRMDQIGFQKHFFMDSQYPLACGTLVVDGVTRILRIHETNQERRKATLPPMHGFALRLASLGVSILDPAYQELFFISMNDIRLNAETSGEKFGLELRIARMQFDSCRSMCKYPVILYPTKVEIEKDFLHLSLSQSLKSPMISHYYYFGVALQEMEFMIDEEIFKDAITFAEVLQRVFPSLSRESQELFCMEKLSMDPTTERNIFIEEIYEYQQRASPFHLFQHISSNQDGRHPWMDRNGLLKTKDNFHLPEGWIWKSDWVVDMFNQKVDGHGWQYAQGWDSRWYPWFFSANLRRRRWVRPRVKEEYMRSPEVSSKIEVARANLVVLSDDSDERSSKMYIEYFSLGSLSAHFSFYPSLNWSKKGKDVIFLKRFLGTQLKNLTHIDRAHIKLNQLIIENVFCDDKVLLASMASHYENCLKSQMQNVVGHLEVIGSPLVLFAHIGTGVQDFFVEPVQAMVHSPDEIMKSVEKGTKSLVKNTMYGVFNSASKAAGCASRGLAALSFDKQYLSDQKARSIDKNPRNVMEGVYEGFSALGNGLFGGVTGIISKPYEEVKKQKTLKSLAKGVGIGVIGVVTKPTAGVLEFASKLSEGIKNSTSVIFVPDRVRLPRPTPFDESAFGNYNSYDAQGQSLLSALGNSKYRGEPYIFHKNLGVCWIVASAYTFLLTDPSRSKILSEVRMCDIESVEQQGEILIIQPKYKTRFFIDSMDYVCILYSISILV